MAFFLAPDTRISSKILSKRLGIPHTTIQRRRKFLEKTFLSHDYRLKLENLGFRRIDFFIATEHGSSLSVAKRLLDRKEIVQVATSIGEQHIDFRAELIIKDNAEVLDMLEFVKAMEGVKDVLWSEIVQVIGKKKSIPSGVIDRL
jgi:hypothetical protein